VCLCFCVSVSVSVSVCVLLFIYIHTYIHGCIRAYICDEDEYPHGVWCVVCVCVCARAREHYFFSVCVHVAGKRGRDM
jgi:hypothetical protein